MSADLAWWRAQRGSADRNEPALREVLERLRAWKAKHDQDRAHHPPPFLRMAWDGVFGDEHAEVAEAIRELEEALGIGP